MEQANPMAPSDKGDSSQQPFGKFKPNRESIKFNENIINNNVNAASDWVVVIACFILICLFALQHFGTHRLGFIFAPIVIMWLVCITILGLYNIFTHRFEVYRALSPYYVYKFISHCTRRDWRSLGSILLCMTGSEAMFADLGHFSQSSIKIAFTFMVYPALILAYMGQAAYHLDNHVNGGYSTFHFYECVPDGVRKYVIVIAILASVVGSQAIITGTFSIIHQALAIGCFPRVKVVHTSNTVHGQIYIPEINWILMILTLVVTIGLRNIRYIGNASGLAVISVMLVTTFLMSLVIIICWRKSVIAALVFLILFGSVEILYFSASIFKIDEGAWVPVVFSIIFMTIMCVWHYVKVKKYEFELKNKLSLDWFLKLASSLGMVRVPGIGLIYSELATGIPAIFLHLVTNMPSFHQVLVFVSIKALSVPHVPPEERYLVGRCGPKEHRIYRCIVRYGYCDNHNDHDILEDQLIYNIKEFITSEASDSCSSKFSSPEGNMSIIGTSNLSGIVFAVSNSDETEISGPHHVVKRRKVTFMVPSSPDMDPAVTEELQELLEASESGTVSILGHSRVQAQSGSSLLKRFSINVVYNFLKSNFRGPSMASNVPHATLLDVGMVYSV
ncbi:potassium transporter 10 [Cryptomeria japonica]|uniref:potassium transporter 10 n=1 Tax=Cryptomeria japonica TaxID=3369 RepID=UPI0027DA12A5|nr:potassium transporter 10 [Cryptomeria japonica]